MSESFKLGTIWRHRKRGIEYRVIARYPNMITPVDDGEKFKMTFSHAQVIEMQILHDTPSNVLIASTEDVMVQCSTPVVCADFLLYISCDDSHLYLRPDTEFLDGRFEQVDAPDGAIRVFPQE